MVGAPYRGAKWSITSAKASTLPSRWTSGRATIECEAPASEYAEEELGVIVRSPGIVATGERFGRGVAAAQLFDPVSERTAVRCDEHVGEVGDLDFTGVAVDCSAVSLENIDLVPNPLWITKHVAGVCVLGDESERLPLPRSPDEDRDVLLDRSRVTDKLFGMNHLALEAWRSFSPQQGQHLQGVFEQFVAIAC